MQQQSGEMVGGGGTHYLAFIAHSIQVWDISRMVDMGMSKENDIDFFWFNKRERLKGNSAKEL